MRGGRAWLGLAALLYLAISLLLQRRVLGDFDGSAIGRLSTDPTGFTWWLAHTAHALTTGTNPLVTDLQHYPVGVNALWNTAVPLLGVLLAPITFTAGPAAAFNTGMVLGPVVSGVAAAAALGGIVRSRAERVTAGGLYAFSPFVLAHLQSGHLNLVWAVLPPVLLALAHRLFVRDLRRPWLLGALTGLALALQAWLYTQTLAVGVLMLVVLALVLAVRYPHRAAARLPALLKAGFACLVVFAVLAGYALYLVLAGPARPRGPLRSPEYGSADLANTLLPTWLTAIRPVPAPEMQGNLGEQGGYLGVAVLLLIVLAVPACGTAARVAAVTGGVAWLLALGPQLFVAAEPTGVPLPWRVVLGVPLLGEIEPVRLQGVVTLAVAVLVGLALDRFPRPVALVAILAVVSWLPADAQRTTATAAPAFPQLAGQVVETWPRITSDWYGGADPLRAQIASGFGYRLTGGYFLGSDADHPVLIESPWNRYQAGAAWSELVAGPWRGFGHLPAPDADAAARDLRATGTTVVLVVPPPGHDPSPVLDWTRRVTGSAGVPLEGAWVFPLAATLQR
ncbi:hypothetical protein GCM10023215_26190 [Pseudonocardia yuanmonensis]|uniref:Glycosyltransferase RgtA/B/C/D-like domain-containing protein n=1 Tax=Pseudonocardia yuanmonensis TaxID=1095914 RepID=A0ABP8WGN0_9PSEU